jgi:hypothetical protein
LHATSVTEWRKSRYNNRREATRPRGRAPKAHDKANELRDEQNRAAAEMRPGKDYFLRWRILARMRRFLRPSFRRPLPDFLTPKASSGSIEKWK